MSKEILRGFTCEFVDEDDSCKLVDILVDENAKLHECLADIASHVAVGDGFGIDRGWVLERIRELGIEEES